MTFKQAAFEISIEDWVLPVRIGILPHEHKAPQPLSITLHLACNCPGRVGENLEASYDYRDLIEFVKHLAESQQTGLLEHFAEAIADQCFQSPLIQRIEIQLKKPSVLPEAASFSLKRCFSRNDWLGDSIASDELCFEESITV